jgi:hypothetical protein
VGEVYDTFGIWTSDGFYLRNLRMQADTGAVYCQLPEGLLREMGWGQLTRLVLLSSPTAPA